MQYLLIIFLVEQYANDEGQLWKYRTRRINNEGPSFFYFYFWKPYHPTTPDTLF